MPITSAVYQPRGVQTTPRLSDFKYALPEKLIAQEPLPHRDESRLLIVDRDTRQIHDGKFTDVLDYLDPGDCLVVNETRVFPARLRGYKEKTEAEIEVFLLRRLTEELWEVLVKPARKVRTGNTIMIGDCITCEVIDNTTSGGRVVRFHYEGDFARAGGEVRPAAAAAVYPARTASRKTASVTRRSLRAFPGRWPRRRRDCISPKI